MPRGPRATRATRASEPGGRARQGTSHEAGQGWLDRRLLGVPARFMAPRLILLTVTFALIAFGLLMIYSASSVTALNATGDAAYYVKRQLVSLAAALALGVLVACIDYHKLAGGWLVPIWVATTLMLLATAAMGMASHGATRWIDIGPVSIQPSELAKFTVVLTAANICSRFFERRDISFKRFLGLLAVGVGAPLVLILAQPDKGTTMVVALTIFVMLYLSGFPPRILLAVIAIAAVGFLAYSLKDDYSRARFLTMFDPWADPYGDGYQLLQGFYAFGSGGLLGVGIGMSRQKYSYLPEAHNDFIFAIIGEECGLVGTLGVIAGFIVFIWAGVSICRRAPDLTGRLIAAGCTSLIAIQALLNILGVLGMFPLSGKTLPFLSYGGSSLMACVMLVGLMVSVSKGSSLPETVHDRRRGSLGVADDGRTGERARGSRDVRPWREEPSSGNVGPVMTRSEAMRTPEPSAPSPLGHAARPMPPRPSTTSHARLTLVEGGASREPATRRPASPRPSSGVQGPPERSGPSGSRERINLGDSAADRLRPASTPRKRDRGQDGRTRKDWRD
ncbi:MAG: FtsW/RodA/SpoVE family cell cycle protein [Atopobiaceae bacterium]|nr:FtsW/RodA/SpoVE family cell cycle protein [Atopobiaceae bacterium]MCH4229491.1 FtsW/RodA/SpoVE family cell cycle protein [Atopobiaceae bacterium]MCI1225806.1 FtsW/RodA/SpoVE family cell cycle protein [Atopobiaceae bacterium]MDD3176733.1 FtsW/RodA/SpoVE family cell cycle protein [Atopobiaceae bacterium]